MRFFLITLLSLLFYNSEAQPKQALMGSNFLFKNCANQVFLNFTLKKSFKVKCSGADVFTDYDNGLLILKPNSPHVILIVIENGKEIFRKDFQVILVPKPKLDIVNKCGNSIISFQGDSLVVDYLASLKLELKADPLFKRMLPKEALYKIQKAEINWFNDKGNSYLHSEVSDNVISPKLSAEDLSRAKYLVFTIEGMRLSNGKEEYVNLPKYIMQVKYLNIPLEQIDSINKCPENFPRCGH